MHVCVRRLRISSLNPRLYQYDLFSIRRYRKPRKAGKIDAAASDCAQNVRTSHWRQDLFDKKHYLRLVSAEICK